MKNIIDQKKIVIIYFSYLVFNCIFLLYFHLDQFPYKYVYTDWLINYEGGFVRRGLLGQVIYELSLITRIDFKYILLFFQVTGYLLYFGLIINFLLKLKINFFWILLIFSTISFLYPFSELEALGRKDIFVILSFAIFAIINHKSLNGCIISFLIIFNISCLIHEITFFYLPYYLLIIFYITKVKLKEELGFTYINLIFFNLILLIYMNLILGSNFDIEEIVISYKKFNIDIGSNTGAFSWLAKPFLDHLLIIKEKFSFSAILRYAYIFLINIVVILYFIKFRYKINFSTINLNPKNIFIGLFLFSFPTYFVALDWGRITYINFNFMLLLIIFFKSENLIDEDFLLYKIKKIAFKFKLTIFLLMCFLFSPKILIDDDLASFPLYRTISKLSGSINLNLLN